MNERREFRRRRVGGNVEITSVMGAGTVPEARAGVLDCSLGGARLRVHSPARRLFRAVPPCLNPHDSITCVLRLAPGYDAIDMFAEVVRVQRAEAEPDYLDVGLRFFHDTARRSHAERPMARLARILEPDRSEEEAAALAKEALAKVKPPEAAVTPVAPAPVSAPVAPAPVPPAAPAASARHGQRLSKQSRRERPIGDDAERPSAPEPRSSQRLERAASARQPAQPNGRGETDRATSGRQRVERGASARVAQISERVRRQPPRPAPPPPSSDSEVVAWASSRLAAVAVRPPERVTTSDDEVSVRGSANLRAGEAVIELPGAFTARARESGLTAHVTPTDVCGGLYVAERSPARLVVRELNGGRTDAGFDFLVVAALRV